MSGAIYHMPIEIGVYQGTCLWLLEQKTKQIIYGFQKIKGSKDNWQTVNIFRYRYGKELPFS